MHHGETRGRARLNEISLSLPLSRPTERSESVAGTRSFSQREGHFHEALKPQHARPRRRAETNRSSRMPTLFARHTAENRVSLCRPRRILRSYLRAERSIEALYCQWFLYLTCRLSVSSIRITRQVLRVQQMKWGAQWHSALFNVTTKPRFSFIPG